MSLPILHDHGARPRPLQPLPGGLALARGRVHEFCGPARHGLAAMLLGLTEGPATWISPGWQAERLFPAGLIVHAEPGRLIFARARRPEDLLWAMEEVLRSGAVPTVIAEVVEPPALTPIRRLHLAAEAGAEAARHRGRPSPLGVLLTAGDGGAQGVESRWHMTPLPSGPAEAGMMAARRWRLERRRARTEPQMGWMLAQEGRGQFRLVALAEADPAADALAADNLTPDDLTPDDLAPDDLMPDAMAVPTKGNE
jgi:protein ImuA